MKTWITADWHIGESLELTKIRGRPFKSSEEILEHILHKHNSLVSKDDRVIVVGDVCAYTAPNLLKYVADFAGTKTLIRGNHDGVIPDSQFLQYFDRVVPEGDGIEIDCGGIPCYVTHYPTRGRKDRFNLVGHIHAAWKYQLNMINVGVDVHHFYPVDLDTIPNHFKAVSEFYDGDVWVAYNEINSCHFDGRGKKGSYFK